MLVTTTPEGSALVVVTRVLAGDEDATDERLMQQIDQQVTARDQQWSSARFLPQQRHPSGLLVTSNLGRCRIEASRQ